MKYPAASRKRILSLFMSLVLMLSMFSAPALAQEDWSLLTISLSWTDVNGNPGFAMAVPVTDSLDQSFWAQVDAAAPLDALTITVMHPNHAYTFTPADGSLLTGVIDAGAIMDMTTVIPITAYENDQIVDTYNLYVSTQPMPAPQPTTVMVDVVYQAADGTYLGGTQVACTAGQATPVYAGTVEGYTPDQTEQLVTVNPDGTYAPNPVIFTYTPNVTEPPAPTEITVSVLYQTVDGIQLDSGTATCAVGQTTTVYAAPIEGYTPDATEKYVTVSADGTPDQNPVIFYYTPVITEPPAPTEITVSVLYQTVDGVQLDSGTATCAVGQATTIYAAPIEGYTPDATEKYVNVSADGTPDQNPVIFYYTPNVTEPPAPTEITVSVLYQTVDGIQLGSSEATCAVGQTTPIYAGTVEGYTPDATEKYVTVSADGTPDQNPVIFYYTPVITEPPAPTEITVSVLYQSTDGVQLGSSEATCAVGQTTPIYAGTVEGYTPDASEKYVTVSADGTPDQNPVIFYYTPVITEPPAPTEITVDVLYQTLDGAQLGGGTVTCAVGQTTPVQAAPFDGYTPDASEKYVAVSADGTPDQNPVIFYYTAIITEPSVPTEITVDIYYLDADTGIEVASFQTSAPLQEGSNVITAAPENLTKGYSIVSEQNETVDVVDGVPNPDTVNFYYRKAQVETDPPAASDQPATPSTASVTVYYQDRSGKDIAGPIVETLEAGKATVIAPRGDLVPSGYKPVQADPVSVTVSADGVPDRDSVTFVYEEEVVETPIPVGAMINRFGKTNDTQVKFRSTPDSSGKGNIIKSMNKGTTVWMIQEQVTDAGENWTQVLLDGVEGYVMSKFLTVMTEEESRAFEAAECPTPVPRYPLDPTDAPTEAPTEAPTDTPTPTPTPTAPAETAAPTDTSTPTPTPTATPYTGYALTRETVALRTEVSTADSTIIATLPAKTLLLIDTQTYDETLGALWSRGITLDQQQGYVPDSALDRINAEEADYYIRQWEAANNTPTPSPSPEPPQQVGYAYTIGDGVYFRSMPSTVSSILDVLGQNIPVYVMGQQYVDGVAWHIVNYNGQYGYIRADLLHMMSVQETLDYLENLKGTPTPAPSTTPQPYDENALSSYGYVTSSSVNFRKSASTSSSKLRELKRYAFCLILGTEQVNGTTWYKVSYGGTTGYIMGDYFKQMTMAELEDFLGSEEYKQGIANNSSSSNNNTDNTGTSGSSGGITSAEDQTVSTWTNPNNSLNVSYAPFDPFATVEPLPTSSASPSVSPSDEPDTSDLPDPMATTVEPAATVDVTYPQDGENTGSSVGWIIGVLVVLLCAGGGAYGYIVYRQNKRRAAQQRAAAKRAAAQRSGQRPAGQPQQPPRPGTNPQQGGQQPQARKPYAPTPGQPQGQNPYARPGNAVNQPGATGSSYRRPEVKPAADATAQPRATAAPNAQPQGQNPYAASFRPTAGTPGTATKPAQPQQPYTASYRPTGDTQAPSGAAATKPVQAQQPYNASYRPTGDTQAPSGAAATKPAQPQQPYTASYRPTGDAQAQSGAAAAKPAQPQQPYTASYRPTGDAQATSGAAAAKPTQPQQPYTASYRPTGDAQAPSGTMAPRRRAQRTQSQNTDFTNDSGSDA